jgi:hypothetical protein
VLEPVESPVGPRFSHRLHDAILPGVEAHKFRRH